MTDGSEPGWVEVDRFPTRAAADQHALVLTAMGISCRLVMHDDGAVVLAVARADAPRARRELAAYARENQRRGRPAAPLRGLAEGIDGAMAYCAILLFLHGASRRQTFGLDWWSAGVAQAGLIAGGEWWRTVTALGLHADLGHLAGNLAFGALLGLLLAQLMGAGLAWLAILVAGAVGNALGVPFRAPDHTAVGASTAVFGALGLLAALAWRREGFLWRHGLRRWLPLAAGFMILAYMGFGGERTDIGAHVTGFIAGGALGAGVAYAGHRVPQGRDAQRASGVAALALVALAWLLALRAHG